MGIVAHPLDHAHPVQRASEVGRDPRGLVRRADALPVPGARGDGRVLAGAPVALPEEQARATSGRAGLGVWPWLMHRPSTNSTRRAS